MWHHDEYEVDEPFIIIEKHPATVSSFLWGVAIGAGVALLLAPKSGEETRVEIGRRARRVKDAAHDAAEDLSDSVVDRYQNARQAVEERIDSARQAIELKREQASEAIRAGREAAQQAREELERRITETKAAYQAGGDSVRRARPARTARPIPAAVSQELDDDDDSDDAAGG